MKENNTKITADPNEFTDFENVKLEHPENRKTSFATNWRNHPGDGVTLRQNRFTSHVLLSANAASH